MSVLTWEKVVLYGDSLTQLGFGAEGCWVAMLADKLQRKCDVLNRGFSGYNSQWNRIMLPRIISAENSKDVAAFVIFLGANDSNKPERNPRQHCPVNEYEDNLFAMVEYLVSAGISREQIILIGPPPCDESQWQQVCNLKGYICGKDNAYVANYSIACRNVATKSNVEFIELYETFMKLENWQSLFSDGLHFAPSGSAVVDSLVWPAIEKRTASISMKMPDWSDIDVDHPEISLL